MCGSDFVACDDAFLHNQDAAAQGVIGFDW
jgi:hypothetical protein